MRQSSKAAIPFKQKDPFPTQSAIIIINLLKKLKKCLRYLHPKLKYNQWASDTLVNSSQWM